MLVLINGKRRHSSSLVYIFGTRGRGNVGTDLNTIPVSAIERIEILRDGAAAHGGCLSMSLASELTSRVDEAARRAQPGALTTSDFRHPEGAVMPPRAGDPSSASHGHIDAVHNPHETHTSRAEPAAVPRRARVAGFPP